MRPIFVFGSNLAGRHGKGAALFAKRYHGAIQWEPKGLQGNSYAIPTKNRELKPLMLPVIATHINEFIDFAILHPTLEFNISRIGCGLAGYDWDRDIRPLFPDDLPSNCSFI